MGSKFRLTYIVSVAGPLILLGFMVLIPQTGSASDKLLYTLKQAIETALARNPDLHASRMDMQASRASVKKARGRLLPRLDLFTSYTRHGDPMAIAPATAPSMEGMSYFSRDLYATGLRISLPLYEGGMLRSDIKAAFEDAAGSQDETLRRKQLLAAMVSENYYQLLYMKALLKSQEETLGSLEKTRDDANLRLKLGKIPPLDLMEMDTEVSAQRQAVVSTRQAIKRTRQRLAVYLGMEPSSEPEVVGRLHEPEIKSLQAHFLDDLIDKRPDIMRALRQIAKAEIMVKKAKGQRLPRAEVFGDYNLTAAGGFNEGENFWSTGVSLSLNIFDGGTIAADVSEAESRLMAARNRLKALRLEAKSEILAAVSAFMEAQASLSLAKRVQTSAKEAFRIERLRYENGVGTVRELLKAQAAWQGAVAKYIKALYELQRAVIAWKLAAGNILPF